MINCMNSWLFFVRTSRLMIFSMDSSADLPLKALRMMLLARCSCSVSSRSSRRVLDFGRSMAGKMRRSERSRFSTSSMLPVPLNSSKMTSSMRLPVSTSAVARIVRLPPSFIQRAAPKNFLGMYSAFGSRPPESVRPLETQVRLYARARRVILSSRMTTSSPYSTSLLARSIVISDTRRCWFGSSSKVE